MEWGRVVRAGGAVSLTPTIIPSLLQRRGRGAVEVPRLAQAHTLTGLSRRTLLAVSFATGLTACSLAETDMVLEVPPDSLSPFVDAMTGFAKDNDYELRGTGPGLLDFSYEGRHATMVVSQFEPGMFHIVFQARPPEIWEWFFDFGPDVSSIASDFRQVVLLVDGVREHETWPP